MIFLLISQLHAWWDILSLSFSSLLYIRIHVLCRSTSMPFSQLRLTRKKCPIIQMMTFLTGWRLRRTKGFKLLFNYVDRDIRHCAHTYTHIHLPAHTINRSRGSVGKKKKGIITAKWYEENLSAAELDLFDSWCNWWWFDFGLVWMASYGGGSLLKTSQRTFSFSFLILLTQLWNAPSSRLVAAAARQEVGRSPTHGATWSRPDQAADDAPSKGL